MKRFFQFTTLLLIFAFFVSLTTAEAQRSKSSDNDEYFDESGGFKHRLWYGGGFLLGFSGTNNYSAFTFGLSPMVGYKILENVSVGPRIGFEYSFLKDRPSNLNVETFSYSFGTFARFKFLQALFAQVELEFENNEFPTRITSNGIETAREGRQNFYIGLGYTSGGIWAYEILLLYNTTEPDDSIYLPFDLRFGITYNF